MKTYRLHKAWRWEEEIQDAHFDKTLQTKQSQNKSKAKRKQNKHKKTTMRALRMNTPKKHIQNDCKERQIPKSRMEENEGENESINDNPHFITQKENDKRRIQC